MNVAQTSTLPRPMHVSSTHRIFWTAALSLIVTSCAGATSLYVATTGSDENTGTRGAPFSTIARADLAARPGDTIFVAPGTYRIDAPAAFDAGIVTTRSGTASARITYRSTIRQAAKILMSGTGIAWHAKGSHVNIDGFDISGSGRLGILVEGSNTAIRNNVVHDLLVSGGCDGNGGAAIDTYGTGHTILIEANIVRNIGYRWIESGTCNTVQGIYISNADNTVVNNRVSGVAAVGIQQWHGATSSTIVNNTVFHNKIGILIGQGDAGASARGSENNHVANNIVYDNKKYGIVEQGKVGRNNRYVNNLVHSSGTNVQVAGEAEGTILADPQFIDYQSNGKGDYRLLNTSPVSAKNVRKYMTNIDSGKSSNNKSVSIGASVR